jgi:hypothetical protein
MRKTTKNAYPDFYPSYIFFFFGKNTTLLEETKENPHKEETTSPSSKGPSEIK